VDPVPDPLLLRKSGNASIFAQTEMSMDSILSPHKNAGKVGRYGWGMFLKKPLHGKQF
jgi:hypothetical protein